MAVRPRDATSEGDGGWFYRSVRLVLGTAYRLLIPVKVVGVEHLPRQGAVILAANHLSFFDTVVLMFSVPRRTYFVGKAEYMDSWTTRRLFPAFGLIPIERSAARQAMAALSVAADALGQGHVLGIYPEGTRSRDGLLHRGHTGVAQLAMMSGALVVPVGLVGTDRIQPVGARLPRPFRRAEIRFGPALDPAAYSGSSPASTADVDRRLDGGDSAAVRSTDVGRLCQRRTAADTRRQRVGVPGPSRDRPRRDVAPSGEVRGCRDLRSPRRRSCRRGPSPAVPHRARRRGPADHRAGDLCEVPTCARSNSMNDSVYQVVELIGSSSDSWELAAQNAVREASKSYKDLRVAEVVEMDVLIEAGTIIAYRTKLRLSFKSDTAG